MNRVFARRAQSLRSRFSYIPAVEQLDLRCLPSAGFLQSNLVSDVPGLAQITDPHLLNPWGISFAPGEPFWLADASSGLSSVYDDASGTVPFAVAIPPLQASAAANPTGTVFNNALSGFSVSQNGHSGPSLFLFATLEGTIAGWNPRVDPMNAIIAVNNAGVAGVGPVYTGLTLATTAEGEFLYAADFRTGAVDVFNATFQRVQLAGAFKDPSLPAGFVPFNVQAIGDSVYVTYTHNNGGRYDQESGAGNGYVDVFNTSGGLVRRLVSEGPLNGPWGVALAPENFGKFSNDLLVGNFLNGRINAFNPDTGDFLGTLADDSGTPITIPDLWSLTFTGGDDSENSLYVTAGLGGEQHGLFAELQPTAGLGTGVTSAGQAAAFSSLVANLPQTGEDGYPLPPTSGPALRSDGGTQTPLVSAILRDKATPLGMAPTLLTQQALAGSPSTGSVTVNSSVAFVFVSPAAVSGSSFMAPEVYDWGLGQDFAYIASIREVRPGKELVLAGRTGTDMASPSTGPYEARSFELTAAEEEVAASASHAEAYSPAAPRAVAALAADTNLTGEADAPASAEQRAGTGWVALALVGLIAPFLWRQRPFGNQAVIGLWSRLTRRFSKTIVISVQQVPAAPSH